MAWGWGKGFCKPWPCGTGDRGWLGLVRQQWWEVARGSGRMGPPGELGGTRSGGGDSHGLRLRHTHVEKLGAGMPARKRAVRNSEMWESAVSWKPGNQRAPSPSGKGGCGSLRWAWEAWGHLSSPKGQLFHLQQGDFSNLLGR